MSTAQRNIKKESLWPGADFPVNTAINKNDTALFLHSTVSFDFYEFQPSNLPVRTASKSSSTSLEGAAVSSDTTTMQIEEKMNAGSSS